MDSYSLAPAQSGGSPTRQLRHVKSNYAIVYGPRDSPGGDKTNGNSNDRGGISKSGLAGILVGVLAMVAIASILVFCRWKQKPQAHDNATFSERVKGDNEIPIKVDYFISFLPSQSQLSLPPAHSHLYELASKLHQLVDQHFRMPLEYSTSPQSRLPATDYQHLHPLHHSHFLLQSMLTFHKTGQPYTKSTVLQPPSTHLPNITRRVVHTLVNTRAATIFDEFQHRTAS
ncbi:uncharacterized protein VTP21DRAFT_4288 [Calcarisporiella thermophila]|uniref:uncharacterized protein n=1 Tax=Calcarisporiella thermophila TaxID=911321 RepID=UPI00374434C9